MIKKLLDDYFNLFILVAVATFLVFAAIIEPIFLASVYKNFFSFLTTFFSNLLCRIEALIIFASATLIILKEKKIVKDLKPYISIALLFSAAIFAGKSMVSLFSCFNVTGVQLIYELLMFIYQVSCAATIILALTLGGGFISILSLIGVTKEPIIVEEKGTVVEEPTVVENNIKEDKPEEAK